MPSHAVTHASTGTTRYTRVAGPGVDMPVDEVLKNVARYAELQPDPNAFVDRSDPTRRLPIRWPISPGHRAAPAGIAAPHGFHMSFLETRAGNSPVVHAHAYREVFMPVRGNYRIYFNKDCAHSVLLGPLDVFSVPPLLWRRVEQEGAPGDTGLLMVIYDDVEDPNSSIFVPQEVIDADRARGHDPYAGHAGAGGHGG
jgi:hypothetical protein